MKVLNIIGVVMAMATLFIALIYGARIDNLQADLLRYGRVYSDITFPELSRQAIGYPLVLQVIFIVQHIINRNKSYSRIRKLLALIGIILSIIFLISSIILIYIADWFFYNEINELYMSYGLLMLILSIYFLRNEPSLDSENLDILED